MLRLLLVEDHAAVRAALALVLGQRPDMEMVAQCGSVAGVLALGRGVLATIDVALLDLMLPDGDGAELIPVLREANPSVRVLVLSASVEPGLRQRAAEAGADGLLNKAEALTEIVAEVARLGGAGKDRG